MPTLTIPNPTKCKILTIRSSPGLSFGNLGDHLIERPIVNARVDAGVLVDGHSAQLGGRRVGRRYLSPVASPLLPKSRPLRQLP